MENINIISLTELSRLLGKDRTVILFFIDYLGIKKSPVKHKQSFYPYESFTKIKALFDSVDDISALKKQIKANGLYSILSISKDIGITKNRIKSLIKYLNIEPKKITSSGCYYSKEDFSILKKFYTKNKDNLFSILVKKTYAEKKSKINEVTINDMSKILNHDPCSLTKVIKYLKIQPLYIKGLQNHKYYSYEVISLIRDFLELHKTDLSVFLAKKTKEVRYGSENYNNSEKRDNTCLSKYGDKNYRNNNKARKTKLKKYKTNNVKSVYAFESIKFDSFPELAFYLYNTKVLNNHVQRGNIFEYEFDGKKYNYECDFYMNGENIEIKGDHFLDKNNNLISPFNISKEKKEKLEKKNECMKRNNVKIIRYSELKNVMETVKNQFNDLIISSKVA